MPFPFGPPPSAQSSGPAAAMQLSQSIEKMMEKRKTENNLATTLRKKLSIVQPERKDEFGAMGLSDLVGEDLGHAEKVLTARNAKRDDLLAAQLAEQIGRTKQMEAEADLPGKLMSALEERTKPGQFPPTAAGYDQAVDEQSGLPPISMALLRGAATGRTALAPGVLDDIIKPKAPQMTLTEALAAAKSPPAGFSQGAVQVNPNGSASISFATAKDSLKAEPILLPDGTPSGKAKTEDGEIIDVREDKSKALTDTQSNALQYSERMKFNNAIVEKLTKDGFNPAGASGLQGLVPNVMASDSYQQYDTAARNWVSAVLRKESGAAISKSEEEQAMRQYFPRFGDSKNTVQQKASLRKLAEENMRKAVGDIQRQAPVSASGSAASDVLKQARDAIQRGKAPDAVKKRYKELTGEDYPSE